MTPEEKRREAAAERVAHTATVLSEALALVAGRAERLEQRIRTAAWAGVSQVDVEAMTRDGLEGLPFPGVQGMIRDAYADLWEVTGQDTRLWCLAHRRPCRWLPHPAWWIHDDGLRDHGRPASGTPGHPDGCSSMWSADAPITVTRKAAP